MRIGYLIPEFPGQTHIFFWREREALRKRGIQAEIVSTRRPPQGVVSHQWSQEAIRETLYLFPPTSADLVGGCRGMARAAPVGWERCLGSVRRTQAREGFAQMRQKARLAGFVFLGARLADVARSRGWTHIHCHSSAESAQIVMFAHLLSGIPYSMTLHGPLAWFGSNQREKWRYASLGIAVTEVLRREMESELTGDLPGQLVVAPMGVDTMRFRRSRPFVAWQGQGPLRVFSCGRLNPSKGHIDLAKAVALVRGMGIDTRLFIAGEDDSGGDGYRRKLESEIDRSSCREFVTLLGAVSEDRVIQELQDAHVFALASREEAIGVAIMEAMAMEVPVIVTRVGGVSELVGHELDGLSVPAQSPASLAEALLRLARDPELALRLGGHGRETVEGNFQATRSADVLARHVLEQDVHRNRFVSPDSLGRVRDHGRQP